ncbi:molybdenum cofactor guanylyltransferase [Novosphingobium piscinae]|uniref:Molybdenum cofactor guanylyltransferase n=1 Tax=Novosphingobium piscinae TaxID=1507448 RepID=A0A7X1KPD2_9SPHN|nr:molybdenum cofactor guanylyltransferase [Novosphingobium piscinae]MBC2668368.1 molybdenum cofactor guanylyltransferase [Novosphingobium piscinae]
MADRAPVPTPAPAPVPAIVIATGGAGRRIGGDKPAVRLARLRLVDHVIAWARRHGDAVALAGAADGPPDPSGLPTIVDRHSGCGPIAALHGAMVHAAALGRQHVLLLGCDMPFLPDDLLDRLVAALDGGGAGAALPRRAGWLHPLAGLWRCDPAGLDAWIETGGRALRGYAETVGLALVDWPANGPDPFANLNTPADLAAAEARLRAPEP